MTTREALDQLLDTLGRQSSRWRDEAARYEQDGHTDTAFARRTCAENLDWLVRRWREQHGEDWHPIATAPKDGTMVGLKSPYGEYTGYWSRGFGWFSLNHGSPTHWRRRP